MTEPTHGDFDVSQVDGIDRLKERMVNAETIEDWSFILADYISFGNNKIHKSVGIFNMNSATDCPNAKTDNCQVPWDMCYAHKAENQYPQTLPYRRRQEYLWDCLDADTFAKAFLALVERKRNEVTAIRFSEAGDFRHRGDIIKVDRIAEIVGKEGIDVYTYSASNYLNWSHAEYFTVNQSNDFEDYGDRLYSAIDIDGELPDNAVWCPHDKQKAEGVNPDDAIQCGECRLCINAEGPDVFIPLH